MHARIAALALASLAASSAARADEPVWPCFHGPRRDNKSTETGLLKRWPDGGPRLLWAAEGLGKGYSSVAVAGGRIFTAGTAGPSTCVFAIGLEGKVLWRAANGRMWRTTMSHATAFGGARSTPTYDDGRVYHLGETGRLTAFEADTGREVWSRNLPREFDAEQPKYGYTESVLVRGDRLYCCPAGEEGFVVCLDKGDGETIWACKGVEGTAGYSSLVPARSAGVEQLVGMSSSRVYGVSGADGRKLWSVPLSNYRDNNATDPVCGGNAVFAASGYGAGCLLVRLAAGAGGGVAAETAWKSKLLDNHHGGVLLHEGHLYGSGHDAKGWHCLDFATGKPAWRAEGKGALTFADGMLYLLDERGLLTLAEATPAAFRPVSRFKLPSGGPGRHWAHPVVCAARLYIRHAGKLFAYDVSGGGTS